MEYSPPPLFKQGPSALARLVFFVALALVLLISDARFRTLEIVRGVLDVGLYPLQRAALVPRDLVLGATSFVVGTSTLRSDNAKLSARNLQLSVEANRNASLAAENAHLRALLDLSKAVGTPATPAEIQYDTRDPFTQKVVIGRGSQQDIQNGSPVVTEDGMIGQVTRVFPMQAEVTLLTDKDQAVPVQIVRTGLRGVVYGTPAGNGLELRFVPISADIVAGDELVTSGLDGVYPAGLPVAKVVRVDKQGDTAFAHVTCVPIAAVRGARDVLVIHYRSELPPRPETQPETTGKGAGKKGSKAEKGAAKAESKGENADKAAANAAAGASAKSGEKLPAGKPSAETPSPAASGTTGTKPAEHPKTPARTTATAGAASQGAPR
ncbi:rod shape-determining protein MreC [Trinickia caryophylli]|uniref:Cell shape-determining protein MreC n=1 Tax=Trinickia caryophylli TaxID=28094 RepID=A0A1X7F9M1_TRICW|nr:rod shape-determining protein MreC [Trinickia caryophylli]PMS10977.1 rod shape-determining protein MreC [Trinickia caryophylli]TRX18928.1 rod shape-determining protein MreC [Trinickia caryophylli]WQE10273.1 rod shape-determining protein MreC [Trinickia caryophylli]SMF48693.1 rod shape-determining protein MreC [Trinickia caryophylli]GLU34280.1 rod shape-determining protein MreC [Trinickia caryophylli]